MAPKKKKEKKPKLTKEEKKRLKLIAAEEQRRELKRSHLSREIRLGQITLKKHEKQWREMLIKISLPQVREELEFAWHTFERIVDAKDFQISLLMDEVEDAEEQYMLNFRSHCADIDKLITMFRDRLLELKEGNDRDVAELRSFQDSETMDYKHFYDQEDHFLKVMMFGLAHRRKVHENAARADYISRLDEEQNKFIDFLQKQRANLEAIMSDIWTEYKTLFKEHLLETEDRRKGYLALKKQDDYMTKLLAIQLNRTQKSYDHIKKLTNQYNALKKSQDQKIQDLQGERQFFVDTLFALKNRLEKESFQDNKQISLVTIESNKSMDFLRKNKNLGMLILKAAQVCRQLETNFEKIKPFPETGIGELNFNPETDESVENRLMIFDDLRNFWQRVAQADAFRYRLKEELMELKMENVYLHRRIHEFCQCAVCVQYPVMRPSRRINPPSVVEASCVHKWII